MPLFTRVRSWYQKAAASNSDLSGILDIIQGKASESRFANTPSYTVCIVEDNAECAAALIDKVAASSFSEGFEVHEMASRAELESFVSEGRAIDILITDINLGTDAADGISMVRDLFPTGSKTQVIYATGYIEYCTPVYETQHVYFLVKPVRQSALDDALKTWTPEMLRWSFTLRPPFLPHRRFANPPHCRAIGRRARWMQWTCSS